MSNGINAPMTAPMADWSTNSLSTESCVLSTGDRRSPIHLPLGSARGRSEAHQPQPAGRMDGRRFAPDGGR